MVVLAGPTTSPARSAQAARGGHLPGLRLHDFLDYWARQQPDVEFATQGDRGATYAHAQLAANRLANALVRAGLERGDRIAIVAKNCIEYALLQFACWKSGVVPVPLNYRSAPAEWTYIINDAGAKLLIAQDPYTAAIDRIRGDLASVTGWVALGAGGAPPDWTDWQEWTASEPPE